MRCTLSESCYQKNKSPSEVGVYQKSVTIRWVSYDKMHVSLLDDLSLPIVGVYQKKVSLQDVCVYQKYFMYHYQKYILLTEVGMVLNLYSEKPSLT